MLPEQLGDGGVALQPSDFDQPGRGKRGGGGAAAGRRIGTGRRDHLCRKGRLRGTPRIGTARWRVRRCGEGEGGDGGGGQGRRGERGRGEGGRGDGGRLGGKEGAAPLPGLGLRAARRDRGPRTAHGLVIDRLRVREERLLPLLRMRRRRLRRRLGLGLGLGLGLDLGLDLGSGSGAGRRG